MPMDFLVLTVEGMSCSHCENAIKSAIGALNGVSCVNVDLNTKKVTVEFDMDRVSPETIKNVVQDEGYTVKEFI